MLNTDILEKLFRVQATIEHILTIRRVDEIEARYLRQALELQGRAVKEVALLCSKGGSL